MKRWARSRPMGIGRYVVCPFCPDRRTQALSRTESSMTAWATIALLLVLATLVLQGPL